MPRPAFRITQVDDAIFAYEYVVRLVNNEKIDVSEYELKKLYAASEDPEAMQAWCTKHLKGNAWEKFKTACRQSRFKSQKKNKKVGIDLTPRAHAVLCAVAEQERVSLSEAIEMMEAVYWHSKGKI